MLQMHNAETTLRRLLIWIVILIAAIDCVWAGFGAFKLERGDFFGVAALSAALLMGAWFYRHIRVDQRLSAMLFGTAFLCGFSAAFSVLNYLLLTVAGARIDDTLAEIDKLLGFDWPALMAIAADHPVASLILKLAYLSVLPQIALLMVCLGVFGHWRKIYAFCLALALSAAVTVGFWVLLPSFGAFAAHVLDPTVAARLDLAVDASYVKELVGLLANGPGRIAPDQIKGLIAFPSYHAVLAVLVAWYARQLYVVGWPMLGLNALVLIATPIHGGHFVIDVFAGVAVALGAVALVQRIPALRRLDGVAPERPRSPAQADAGRSRDIPDAIVESTG